jgi:hypothetical protein
MLYEEENDSTTVFEEEISLEPDYYQKSSLIYGYLFVISKIC